MKTPIIHFDFIICVKPTEFLIKLDVKLKMKWIRKNAFKVNIKEVNEI